MTRHSGERVRWESIRSRQRCCPVATLAVEQKSRDVGVNHVRERNATNWQTGHIRGGNSAVETRKDGSRGFESSPPLKLTRFFEMCGARRSGVTSDPKVTGLNPVFPLWEIAQLDRASDFIHAPDNSPHYDMLCLSSVGSWVSPLGRQGANGETCRVAWCAT